MGKPFIELKNQTFDHWTVTGPHQSKPRPDGRGNRTMWFCTCQCGNTGWVDSTNLRGGISTNCGCQRETKSVKQQAARSASGKANRTHGMSRTPLYIAWFHMKRRCTDPRETGYEYYGGKGITYCPEWETFEGFFEWAQKAGYKDNQSLTLERNDVKQGYYPENCRFIPKNQQTWNTNRNIRLPNGESISSFASSNNVPLDLVWHAVKLCNDHPKAWNNLLQMLGY
jgi:hypothetical protein